MKEMTSTLKFALPAFAAVFLSAPSAKAVLFADADYFGTLTGNVPSGILLSTAGPTSTTGTQTFNLVNSDGTSGFTLGSAYGMAAGTTFSSALDFEPGIDIVDPESVSITLMGRKFTTGEEFIFSIALESYEVNGSFFGTFILGPQQASVAVEALLNNSGTVSYSVTATDGSFYLDGAYLEASTHTVSVPDGGATLALLGLTLVGLEGLRRGLKTGLITS